MLRTVFAALIFFIFYGQLQAFNYTNSVIAPLKHVRSYEIIQAFLNTDPSIIITRKFNSGKKSFYYYINTETLQYGITDEWKDLEIIPGINAAYTNSRFYKLMNIQVSGKLPFGNKKEKFSEEIYTNIVLTSDLCPSRIPYAQIFYKSISNAAVREGVKIPFVLFFSGKWIMRHARELNKIKRYPFTFTAGNHTFSHTILTNSHTSEFLISEITNNERVMLENGLLPSYIFRFPGLKHSRKDITAVSSINIIAMDANEWMGKKIRDWKVLLVHSNGNAFPEDIAFSNFLTDSLGKFKDREIVFRDVFDYFYFVCSITNN